MTKSKLLSIIYKKEPLKVPKKAAFNRYKALLIHINDGVTYYRHMMPVNYLSRIWWSFAHTKFDWGKTDWDGLGEDYGHTDKDVDKLVRSVDLIVSQRNDVPMYIAQGQLTQAHYKIPWVYDTDDNVHAIQPSNMGFGSYNPTSRHPHWAMLALESAFAVTVSTENLKKVYEKTNKRIYVLPNGVDFERWDAVKPEPKPEGEIRISMVLSGSHGDDMAEIDHVLCAILEEYPDVKLYVMDAFKGSIFRKLSAKARKQLIWTEWVNPGDWSSWNKKMNFDIGLAPLLDNDFNRAKSNLRWLEYSAMSIPTIASDVEPHQCAKDGETIVLARDEAEWYDKLVEMIENEELRKKIGMQAYKVAKEKYDMNVLVKEYDRVYREIIRDFRKLYGEPKRDDKDWGVNQAAINTDIESFADDITEGNTGKRPHSTSRIKYPAPKRHKVK